MTMQNCFSHTWYVSLLTICVMTDILSSCRILYQKTSSTKRLRLELLTTSAQFSLYLSVTSLSNLEHWRKQAKLFSPSLACTTTYEIRWYIVSRMYSVIILALLSFFVSSRAQAQA